MCVRVNAEKRMRQTEIPTTHWSVEARDPFETATTTMIISLLRIAASELCPHTNPQRIPLLSHRRRHSAHLRILHTSSSFFFLPSFLRPSTHHGPTADRPTDRPTRPSVRPRHQSSHHHHRTRSRLAHSLARSMPTHTRRRSTAHARALLPDLRSLALARSLARLSHSLHYLLIEPAASLRHRERGKREREGANASREK